MRSWFYRFSRAFPTLTSLGYYLTGSSSPQTLAMKWMNEKEGVTILPVERNAKTSLGIYDGAHTRDRKMDLEGDCEELLGIEHVRRAYIGLMLRSEAKKRATSLESAFEGFLRNNDNSSKG